MPFWVHDFHLRYALPLPLFHVLFSMWGGHEEGHGKDRTGKRGGLGLKGAAAGSLALLWAWYVCMLKSAACSFLEGWGIPSEPPQVTQGSGLHGRKCFLVRPDMAAKGCLPLLGGIGGPSELLPGTASDSSSVMVGRQPPPPDQHLGHLPPLTPSGMPLGKEANDPLCQGDHGSSLSAHRIQQLLFWCPWS